MPSAFSFDHESLDSAHLLDFLRRCEGLGLHVNLSLAPGSPMSLLLGPDESAHRVLPNRPERHRLAYDIAWEPTHGGYCEQPSATTPAFWHQWVINRYGTIPAATNAWGVRPAIDPHPRAPRSRRSPARFTALFH